MALVLSGCGSAASRVAGPAVPPTSGTTPSPTAAATTPAVTTPALTAPALPVATRAAATAKPTRSSAPVTTRRPTASPSPRVGAGAPPAGGSAAPPTGASAGRHTFPITGCTASYGRSHHDYPATDIFAARGCTVVAPVTGRVDEVSTVDRWSSLSNLGADRGGLSFSIVGDDGVRYYGSHLSRLLVRAGQRVVAGQVLGAVGNTGSARGTATHLHFGLSWPTRAGVWWVRRGEVYPWSYLDSWRAGGGASPVAAVAAAHRRLGDVPPCRADC